MTEEILTAIKEADLVLIGLGEEFDELDVSAQGDRYVRGREQLESEGKLWMLPFYDKVYRSVYRKAQAEKIEKALENLEELLRDKNYFVVSTAMNDAIATVPWKYDRLVMPCGSLVKKQCADCCEESLENLSQDEYCAIAEYVDQLQKCIENAREDINLGICPKCGKPLVLNNIYAEHYDEKGYLPRWQLYTKWLQGTLNRKLVVLELGVGMKFPSVIRWPFEKITFFNNKAHMYRVNEKLYQLSEELKGKGTAIPKNSIDWLLGLC